MKHYIGPDNPMRAAAQEIQDAGERAASLTRQLLAFSRQQVIRPEVVELLHVDLEGCERPGTGIN